MTRSKNTGKTQPKIKHTGKTEPLIDSTKVAKGLGADTVITLQTKDGRNYLEIIRVAKNGRRNKKRVYKLDKKSAKKHVLIATADGEGFWHCISLMRFAKENFWKRVCGYRVGVESLCSVSFYGKK